jgi:squalene-hopene/tetraprenyl-beta-curcumene cyclase
VRWLLDLQNRDGGIPTFCRGWGALPFDRSSPDLTAHTLRAWVAWRKLIVPADLPRLETALRRGLNFLRKKQRSDGSWLPLWFGNEHDPHDENPLYGTAQVVTALREVAEAGYGEAAKHARKGAKWIAESQNEDGGWAGVRHAPSSTEETALAVEALAGTEHTSAVQRGVEWLVDRVDDGEWKTPAPIGFYFAKLWYYERLYPIIWTTAALGRVRRR